jgi:urease alpha subunit
MERSSKTRTTTTRRVAAVSLRPITTIASKRAAAIAQGKRRAHTSHTSTSSRGSVAARFGKLEMNTLQRYTAHYNINPTTEHSKSAHVDAVQDHFVREPKLRESTVIAKFLNKVR